MTYRASLWQTEPHLFAPPAPFRIIFPQILNLKTGLYYRCLKPKDTSNKFAAAGGGEISLAEKIFELFGALKWSISSVVNALLHNSCNPMTINTTTNRRDQLSISSTDTSKQLSMGMVLNLFKTGNDHSLAINSSELPYKQVVYVLQNKVNR